jgi:Rieske Fe-S protein
MAEQTKPTTADRRTVLRTTALGVAAAGVGVTAAACSSTNSVAQGSNATTVQPVATGGASSAATGGASAGGASLATTSQVPVKGGFVNAKAAIVVTQPSAGEYKAFSAICTHQGCTVSTVSNNVIQCPCHGSQYSAATGEVMQGPATQALAAKTVKVDGGNIVEG